MARISPDEAGGKNVCAFLDMLAWSEFTSRVAGSDDGYNVLVGGTLFSDYSDHPREKVWIAKWKVISTAAGRYQLLARYYDAYKRLLRLQDFTPINQDRIAVQMIREQRAMADIRAGRFDGAVEKCRNIWASLPGAGYGQYEHKLDDLRAQFVKAGGSIV